MLNVTEIPFKIHSVDGWEGGAGAGGEADIKTDNLLKCVLCQILSGRWYQPSLVRSTTFKSSDCEGRVGLGWAGRCLAVISFVKH